MPKCGSQITLCDLPIRFDTYRGCSHYCQYCFAQKKTNLADIKKGESKKALLDFIGGKRTKETKWCDWDIPLHWGGMSDPFQPAESKYRVSLECLKVFAETQYPFVVSTKGRLICDPEYLELIKACNCVIQISLVCPEYDEIEPGAPPFRERLEMIRTLAQHKRVNVRMQPYMVEAHDSIMQSIGQFADAGAYGVIVEGMKYAKKKPGLVKVGGDWCYPLPELRDRYAEIREEVHRHGMKFYCGENRLRDIGESLCCCGIDGMEGFRGNDFNLNHILNGQPGQPTEKMQEKGTCGTFCGLYQIAGISKRIKDYSLKDMMYSELANKPEYYMEFFGKEIPKER